MSPSKDLASLDSSSEPFAQQAVATAPKPGLALVVEEARFGICRLPPKARIPRWVHRSSFFTISRSRDELSIVCEQHLMPGGRVPDDVRVERGWRAIRVLEPLDLSLVGVLASLAKPLTAAKVSIFCISTYDTDYLLVRHSNLERAIIALEEAGHRFQKESPEAEENRATGDKQNQKKPAPSPLEKAQAELPDREPQEKEAASAADEDASAPDQDGLEKRSSLDVSALNLPEPAKVVAKTEEPGDSSTTKTKNGARDRVARALADLSTALKTPWRSRAKEEPAPTPKEDRVETTSDGAAAVVDATELLENEASKSAAQEAAPEPDAREVEGAGAREVEGAGAREVEGASAREVEGAGAREVEGDEEITLEMEIPADLAASPTRKDPQPPTRRRRRSVARTAPPPMKANKPRKKATPSREASPLKPKLDAHKGSSNDHTATDEVEVVLDWDAEEGRGEVQAEGLFTGAIPQNEVEVTDQSFGHLGLSNPILETIHKIGFEHPTPIQAQVIPHALKGKDIIGLAETGSGKTAAFCLPMAEHLTKGRGLRGLILCPTREIALQTKAFLEIFGKEHNLNTVAVIGGVRMGPQIEGFRNDPNILVATPGRLADHLRRRNVNLKNLEELVLDEADHMLDLGFLPQIKEILQQAPKNRRTMMFSATMPPPIERLAQMFMRNPTQVDIRPTGQVADGIEHRLYLVRDEDMKACLLKLLEEVSGSTLVFSRRKLYTEWLARQMEQAGLKVARIHSDRSQSQRVQALRGFREGKYRILVATDVAARGLDVPRIEHVINYGLPETTEDYVHRAGRTARGNAVGTVSSIGTWQDKIMVRQLEYELEIKIPRCELEGVEPYKELPKRKSFRRRRLL